jgi:hypothetical protein
MRLIPWRRIADSTPQSPSSGYFTVWSFRKLCMLHNKCEAQLEPGGLPTLPPYLLITVFHGVSSVLHSLLITYLRVCSASS